MSVEDEIIPIQIRDNVIVRIHGIPHDLTRGEATKIANVILALAITKALSEGK
jgi:hypothetical protein